MEKLNITIKRPCSEDYNSFIKSEKGGYCLTCKKTVIDFSKMNNQEIVEYFNSHKGKTCGSFLNSQLNHFSQSNTIHNKPNYLISSLFGFSLISLLSMNNANAQEKEKSFDIVKVETNNNFEEDSIKFGKKITVKGTVKDASGPLPGANVYLKGKNIGVQTDLDGKFTFPEKLRIGDIIVVSFIGLQSRQIVITDRNNDVILLQDIALEQPEVIITGEVSTNKVFKSKKTLFQKIKSAFKNEK